MKEKKEKPRCAHEKWRWGISYPSCRRPGKLEHEGKMYCGTHHPPTHETRKQTRRAAAYEAELLDCARERAKHEKATQRAAILEQLAALAKEYHARMLEDGEVERGAESILAHAGRRLIELEESK